MPPPWPFSLLFRKTPTARTEAQRSGAWGEALATEFLKKKGYVVLGRNVRFGSRCELDLVVRSSAPDILVFAVNRGKRRALGRAAQRYLRRLKNKPAHIRFDVVEVIGQPEEEHPVLRHIENAFSLGTGYRLPY